MILMTLDPTFEPTVGAILLAVWTLDASDRNLNANRRRQVDRDRASVWANVLQVSDVHGVTRPNAHQF
jgi:hypothetical protein